MLLPGLQEFSDAYSLSSLLISCFPFFLYGSLEEKRLRNGGFKKKLKKKTKRKKGKVISDCAKRKL